MRLTTSSTSHPSSASDTMSLTPPPTPKSGTCYGTLASRAARALPSEPSSGSYSSSLSYSSAPSRPGRNISTTPSAPSKLSTASSYDSSVEEKENFLTSYATTFVSASESSETERTPTSTHLRSSRETTQQGSVTETARGPSPTETQELEGSVGSTETECSDGQRLRFKRADSFFSEARSARSLARSTYG